VFLAGIILFCGTLYLKALAILPVATKLAPLGGISFMVGRFLIASAAHEWRNERISGRGRKRKDLKLTIFHK
jgi:uncharacterized membrane protein YgdD (TMEM256/DUF423 family)